MLIAMESVMHGPRDPFAFLLQELRDRDASVEPWAPGQRRQLLDDLLVIEALELAHGRRHLSVVFGEVTDLVEAEQIDELLTVLPDELAAGDGLRIGGSHQHVTVTVEGADADAWIARATQIVERYRWPRWRIVETARAHA